MKWENRTYMPGYDVGDWLTSKSDKDLYFAVKVIEIDFNNEYYGFYNKTSKDELYIRIETKDIKARPRLLGRVPIRNLAGGYINNISYTDLLKNYRPLTNTEKLLYINEY